MTLKLTYNAPALILAEKALGKSLAEIVAELRSDGGASLTTLAELLRVGLLSSRAADNHLVRDFEYPMSVDRGTDAIEEHGIAVCAEAVGEAMRAFLNEISRARAA